MHPSVPSTPQSDDDIPTGYLNDPAVGRLYKEGDILAIVQTQTCVHCGGPLLIVNAGKRIICNHPNGSCDDPYSIKDQPQNREA